MSSYCGELDRALNKFFQKSRYDLLLVVLYLSYSISTNAGDGLIERSYRLNSYLIFLVTLIKFTENFHD